MRNAWVIDAETHPADDKQLDPRQDEPFLWGWLSPGGETAQQAGCACPFFAAWQRDPGPLLAHNAMYDLPLLYRAKGQQSMRGLNLHDTMVMAAVSGHQDISLKGLGQQLFGLGVITSLESQDMEQRNAQDVFLTRMVAEKLYPQVVGKAYDTDRALIPLLVDASFRGYVIDQDRLAAAMARAENAVTRAERLFQNEVAGVSVLKARRAVTRKKWPEDVTGLYGEDVVVGDGPTRYRETYGEPDIGSSAQVQQLFGTDGADAELLAEMATAGSFPAALILEYRRAHKLLTTYLRPYEGQERLAGMFNLTPDESGEEGSSGGRLSSKNPNMQNLHPVLQRCLHAPDGMLLRRGDFPNIELRCAAEISQSPYLIEALRQNRNLHMETRDYLKLCGAVPCGTTRCAHYDLAKRINFMSLYGGGAGRLCQMTGWPMPVCERIIDQFRTGPWKDYFDWGDRHWTEVQHTHYSTSPEPFLHKRYIPLTGASHAYKQSLNHPSQSHAVYICKSTMNELYRVSEALFVSQVHDEIHGNEYLPTVGVTVGPDDIQISKYWDAK